MSTVPFSADHFTLCVLTRIYNSTARVNPKDPALDLSRPENRHSMIAFVKGLTEPRVSQTIFMAVHYPGSLDVPVEFPPELIEEASRVLNQKFNGTHGIVKR